MELVWLKGGCGSVVEDIVKRLTMREEEVATLLMVFATSWSKQFRKHELITPLWNRLVKVVQNDEKLAYVAQSSASHIFSTEQCSVSDSMSFFNMHIQTASIPSGVLHCN